MGPRDVLDAIQRETAWTEPPRQPFVPVSERAMTAAPPPPDATRRFTAVDLRLWREEMGLSRRELGAILGVSDQRIERIERGTFKPSGLDLAALAALQVAVIPMVNHADRLAWLRGLADLAVARDPLFAVPRMLADATLWQSSSGAPTEVR